MALLNLFSKRIYLFSFAFAISMVLQSFTFAGGKIAGKITDKATGNPLPGATIMVLQLNIGAAADLDGDYYILNIPPGRYNVKVTMIGYTPVIKTGVNIDVNHTTPLNFQLEESAVQIKNAIVITAERPLIQKDETSSRHYVTAREIITQPTTQLSQILVTLPGIDKDANGLLTVRQGTLDQVAFLIDGIRANNPLNYAPYTTINLSSIQELEVITGGFNAEYGQAQSGVFNIITKDGKDKFEGSAELRWIPPGLKHWGTSYYDYSSSMYWENSHARHLQWWIDNPNQWVDPNGIPGNNPKVSWTPEQAYNYYMQTHQPLNNNNVQNGFQFEGSLGGPTGIKNLYFFTTGKYISLPPVSENSYLSRGTWFDGTLKLNYNFAPNFKLMFSSYYNESNTDDGMESLNSDWLSAYGLKDKYAYYDFAGYPTSRTDGETIQFTHVLSNSTYYEIQFSRVFDFQSTGTFPNDPNGWLLGAPTYDYIRGVDSLGNPIPGGYNDLVGLHTTGYYYRGEDQNLNYTLSGEITSQVNKFWQIKSGTGFLYYILKRYQESKAFNAIEDRTYRPYEGYAYFQNKLEFEGLVMNLGLRYDFYNPNDLVYINPFDPLGLYEASLTNTTPVPQTKPTATYGQLSPRIGISHPISENTVLHFSYGHFFQRANFGDYGEGYNVLGILDTYLNKSPNGYPAPFNIGNRLLQPMKTVEYEIGIQHNIKGLVLDVTGFYKDITNTVRTVTIYTAGGGRYLTSGNGNYGDAKGVEISIRKPLTEYWGCYLNYSWSTGIIGRSGAPDVIAAPGSNTQIGAQQNIGDVLEFIPSKLKYGFTIALPSDLSALGGILSNIQFSLDDQIYYPNSNISSDVFSEGGHLYVRPAYKNVDFRIRKEIVLGNLKPAIFLEVRNAFNDEWVNLDIVKAAAPADRVKFINSGFRNFPTTNTDGSPFANQLAYLNLPRQIIFGVNISF
ncbi:MAG: TonB-dependent receptor [Ignavibacteriaceae bacterium]